MDAEDRDGSMEKESWTNEEDDDGDTGAEGRTRRLLWSGTEDGAIDGTTHGARLHIGCWRNGSLQSH